MIQLPTQFVSGDGGFSSDPLTYKQLKRTDKVAMYERSRGDRIHDYEIFFIKVEPKGKVSKFPGGVIKVAPDDKELYPSTGQWGRIAWSHPSLVWANRKFDELVKQSNIPDDEGESAEAVNFTIPTVEFTVKEFAEANKIEYSVAFLFIKTNVETGNIKFLREERRAAKGKASKIYAKA
jgi:hypothetical protein